MKKITLGIVAHVDSGKTTLSEAMLYKAKAIRSFGRVDKGDSFLDSNKLERKRGITIYSKQAVFEYGNTKVFLLDTPGHADLSAEMERTLQVLDYALLIVSARDGITGQCENLFRLLEEYEIPVIIFFNKMDLEGSSKEEILGDAAMHLSDRIVSFNGLRNEEFYDKVAMGDEEAMEEFLSNGCVSENKILRMIKERKLFPAFFGSALRQDGIEKLLSGIDELTLESEYPREFGARAFKILRERDGRRLTMMKISGGSLKARSTLEDGPSTSKIDQIRIYSGERFESVQEAFAGDVVAVTGLENSYAGQGFGYESGSILPLISPVLRYRVVIPEDKDPILCLRDIKTLEEESPELSAYFDEENRQIFVKVMGEVQLEVLTAVLKDRFDLDVTFDAGEVIYKETIVSPVIGAGHFEPLRHYAEVILLLEPLPQGSGMEFETALADTSLALNWQRLILTHLTEKEHRGVLTGSPITDMRITLIGGRAHPKHTEGGDFRQAVYRAVRQGLMMAESTLLEPYYRFTIRVPSSAVGRVMTDLDRMEADFQAPLINNDEAVFTGRAAVRAISEYANDISSFTKGAGSISLSADGYGPCRDPEDVIAGKYYDPRADVANTPDSVFCEGGSSIIIPYDQVYEHIHSDILKLIRSDKTADVSGLKLPDPPRDKTSGESFLGTEEVDAIIASISRKDSVQSNGWKRRGRKKNYFAEGSIPVNSSMHGSGSHVQGIFQPENADYLLVDGYNVIFAWEDLNDLAQENMDAARISLMEKLCNWQAFTESEVIVVFDAYRVKGHETEVSDYLNIHVVFTKEAETADQYIEKFAHEKGKKYKVAVVTSDGMEQIIIRGQGCALISSREFRVKMDNLGKNP